MYIQVDPDSQARTIKKVNLVTELLDGNLWEALGKGKFTWHQGYGLSRAVPSHTICARQPTLGCLKMETPSEAFKLPKCHMKNQIRPGRMTVIGQILCRGNKIIWEVCTGMYQMHRQQIRHLDLKSPNILLTDNGHAKIA